VEAFFFRREIWDGLNAFEAKQVATNLQHCLGKPWRFSKIESCAMGDQDRNVAFFTYKGSDFALIPGDEAQLGYDRKKPFRTTEDQAASWVDTATEFGISLKKTLHQSLSRARTVSLKPFLAEIYLLSWRDLWYRFGESPPNHMPLNDFVQKLIATGFRLPTSDEWEYCCAAGSRTLFRWGDVCPTNCYPCETPGDRKELTWNLHRLNNAFGLEMPPTGYESELCWQDGKPSVRGGDGGGATCGGTGFFNAWLTLASSFLYPYGIQFWDGLGPDTYRFRRIYPILEGLLS
jgi:hypothetical protein